MQSQSTIAHAPMDVEITIKNYRCFSEQAPATFTLRGGMTTAFVGVNTAGKSTLLRLFYELRPIFAHAAAQLYSTLTSERYRHNTLTFDVRPPILDLSELFHNRNDRDIELTLQLLVSDQEGEDLYHLPFRVTTIISNGQGNRGIFDHQISLSPDFLRGRSLQSTTNNDGTRSYLFIDKEGRSNLIQDFHLVNILSIFESFVNTLYIGPFRVALNATAKHEYYDLNIGEGFVSTWRQWQAGPTQSWNKAVKEVIDDLKEIFDIKDLSIHPSDTGGTFRLYLDHSSHQLSELGGGIAQIFIILAHAAIKKPHYILIDEPELNLHPSLQLKFMDKLSKYARNGLIFSTHSLGLARSTANQIYSVIRGSDGYSTVHPLNATPRLPEFLGEMNFAAYQELGFEKVVFVEGVTEIKILQQMLRILSKDRTVVLMHLGGSGMIIGNRVEELAEAKRIAPDVRILIDSERTSDGAPLDHHRKQFVESCAEVGIQCTVLERRATENYFPQQAITRGVGNMYRQLGPFERLGDSLPGWRKADSWRIAHAMTAADIQAAGDLGVFLESL